MVLCFLFSALIVALDQFFKQYIVRTLDLGAEGPVIIPGVLGLTRWENDGAMLNILSGQQWLLAAIAFVASVVLIMILLRYDEGFWGTLALSSVLGGTVGNLFDRIFNEGKVIDMFRTLFVNFPIFNIADIFITIGFFMFLIHFIALTFKADERQASASGKAADYSDNYSGNAYPEVGSSEPEFTTLDVQDLHSNQQESQAQYYAQQQAAEAQYYAQQQVQQPVPPAAPTYANTVTTDTTPDVSLTMEALEAELGSLDVEDYDVDELLREYGIEDDDINV